MRTRKFPCIIFDTAPANNWGTINAVKYQKDSIKSQNVSTMTIQNKYRDELCLRNSTFAIDSDSSHQSFANFKFRATIYYKSDVTKTSDLKAGSQAEFKTFNSTYGQMPVPVLELVTYS